MTVGRIHSIETLGTLDGPGTRCVVFLQGCPLRCRYCHNPDTWAVRAGRETSAETLVETVERYRPYFGDEGGLTLSGGEPLAQPDFCREVLDLSRRRDLHVAIDTSGGGGDAAADELIERADLLLLDVKHTDPDRYRELTGRSIEPMRRALKIRSECGKPLWVRQVVAPGWTDREEDAHALADLLAGCRGLQRVELLPYHRMGCEKWDRLGLDYPLDDARPPEPETVRRLEGILADCGLPAGTSVPQPA
jgi:pyruvate formate lyase activating enzyme